MEFLQYHGHGNSFRHLPLICKGLEALDVSIGARDGIGILLGYHASCDPAISLLDLVDFVSAALLESPRLLVLETMASLDMSQHVNGPTHMGIHTLDLSGESVV